LISDSKRRTEAESENWVLKRIVGRCKKDEILVMGT
jgi:hypothetical protein